MDDRITVSVPTCLTLESHVCVPPIVSTTSIGHCIVRCVLYLSIDSNPPKAESPYERHFGTWLARGRSSVLQAASCDRREDALFLSQLHIEANDIVYSSRQQSIHKYTRSSINEYLHWRL
jgi:hypothetical protein